MSNKKGNSKKDLSKGAVVALSVTVVLVAAAVVSFSIFKVIKKNSSDNGKNLKDGQQLQIEQIVDDNEEKTDNPPAPPTEQEIELSKKLEEEIKNDIPDKNPEEIVIPVVPTKEDGATEEEIEEAQKKADVAKEEKSYWTVTSAIKELYEQKYGSDGSYVRNINNIYGAGSTVLGFECEVIRTDANGLLKQSVAYFNMSYTGVDQLKTLSDLKEFVDNSSSFTKKYEIPMNQIPEDKTELVNSFLSNLIFINNLYDYNIVYNSVEIDENNRIEKINIVFEEIDKETGEKAFLKLRTYDFRKVMETMSEEEFLEEINNKNTNLDIIGKGTLYGTELQIDWRNATIEYKGQEQPDETE
ncbi:MAG: hypothetical protein ACI4VW_09325 [Acutalibacteraceae bacterium]